MLCGAAWHDRYESDFIEKRRYHKHSDQSNTPYDLMNDTVMRLIFSKT